MAKKTEKPKRLRITRVYTGFGDKGMTSLAGGQTVSKDDTYMHAFGSVDELQVWIGAARDQFIKLPKKGATALKNLAKNVDKHLVHIQHLLFNLNGRLATTVEDRRATTPLIKDDDIKYLENFIDALNAPLPPLEDFVLPGGDDLTTVLHQCRVVCRRAERWMVALAMRTSVDGDALIFVNRLSDLFFVMARRFSAELRAAGLASGKEEIWKRDTQRPPLPE